MTPETAIKIIDISIVVTVTTLVYAFILLVVRVRGLVKRLERREKEFYKIVMSRLRSGQWRNLNDK